MCRVTPPGYVHEYGETRATFTTVILNGPAYGRRSGSRTVSYVLTRLRLRRGSQLSFLKHRARAPRRQVHVPQGRPGLAPPAGRAARRRQAGVRGRLRGLRHRAPAAGVLDGRHARRHGHDAAHAGDQPRAHPRVPRRARPERADEVVLDPAQLPGHDQAVGVLRRVAPRGPPRPWEVPVRLPVRQDARVVRAAGRRALADHAGAHQGRPRVPADRSQHLILLRAGRSGVRRRVRGRRPGGVPRPGAEAAHDRELALHQARHADLHLRLVLGRARAQRARRRRCPRPARAVTTSQQASMSEIRDITVIGAGPVGLSVAFWAGMRQASSRVIDSLPELGGQCTTLYPEKWIFDVPGHPKVLAKDLVAMLREQALEQFDVPVHLDTTAERISWEDDCVVLHTVRGDLRSRTVIVSGGHGAFEPKRLPGYDMTAWEGRGAYYLVGSKSEFEGKRVVIIGGGDSACDWVVNLLDTAERVSLVHRREGFRAHEATVKEVMDAHAEGRIDVHVPYQVRDVVGNGAVEGVELFHSEDPDSVVEVPCDAILLQLGFKTALGPLKEWGFEIEKGGSPGAGGFTTAAGGGV